MVKPEIRHYLKMAKHCLKKDEHASAIAYAAIGILMQLTDGNEVTTRQNFESATKDDTPAVKKDEA